MSECPRFRSLILAERDGSISPREALDLAGHISCCRRCRHEHLRQRSLDEAFERLPEVEAPAGLSDSVMRRLRRLASGSGKAGVFLFLALPAAAALAALIGLHPAGDALADHGRMLAAASGDVLVDTGRALTLVLLSAIAGEGSGLGIPISRLLAPGASGLLVATISGLMIPAAAFLAALSPLALLTRPTRPGRN